MADVIDLSQKHKESDENDEVDAASSESTDSEQMSQQKEDQETKITVKNAPNQHHDDSGNVGSSLSVKRSEVAEVNRTEKDNAGQTEQGSKKLDEEAFIENSKKLLYEINDPIPDNVGLYKDSAIESQGLYYQHRRLRDLEPWNYPNGVYNPIPDEFLEDFDINNPKFEHLMANYWDGLDELPEPDDYLIN